MMKNGLGNDKQKIEFEADLAADSSLARRARKLRDSSPRHKAYIKAVNRFSDRVEMALDAALMDPEFGVRASRQCTQFTLSAIPDPLQDKGQATSLG